MDIHSAIAMFDALSQETRLKAFRLLVQAGPEGLAAGLLSDKLGTPHNTMSFHLSHLAHAGTISSRKEGRSVIYSANFDAIQKAEADIALGSALELIRLHEPSSQHV